MSIRDAIVNATRQTLGSYLAPELVEQLTEEIVHRVGPEMEAAWTNLAGFDFARPANAMRVRGATPGAGKKAKGRPAKATDVGAESTPAPSHAAIAANGNGNGGGEAQPSH